jgi:MFS family permease
VVSAHVIAMFAPSFFTGHLIARFGAMRIVGTGLFLLALAGCVALTGVELYQFFGALVFWASAGTSASSAPRRF